MNDRDTALTGQKSFDAAVRNYERRTAGKIRALMPYKKGIAELREKQASFKTIASLLKQSGVDVSHDTVARFCRRVLAHPPRQKSAPRISPPGGTGKPGIADLLKSQRDTTAFQIPTMATRRKGPRIADPKNV